MEHANHKISEVNLSLRVKIEAQILMDNLKELSHKLLLLGFVFIRRMPAGINISFTASSISIEPEKSEGLFQMLFHHQENNFIFNIGMEYISFHSISGYAGYPIFEQKFIEPIITIVNELITDIKIIGGSFTYINVFPLNEIELKNNWFTFIPVSDKGFSEFTFITKLDNETTEGKTIDLIDGATNLQNNEGERFFRLNLTSLIEYNNRVYYLKDVKQISKQLHDRARLLFSNNEGEKLTNYIQ